MTEIRFYHLRRRTLEQVLPKLLEMALARGWRCVVMAGSPERVEALTQHLWTWDPASFLPHGSARDGAPKAHPVWLTAEEEKAPNGASVLMLVDGMASQGQAAYDLVCDVFDGNDDEAVMAARERWRTAKAAGFTLTYWQEDERGAWGRKALWAPSTTPVGDG